MPGAGEGSPATLRKVVQRLDLKGGFLRKLFSLQVGTAVPEGRPGCVFLGTGLPQQVLWRCSPCCEPTAWHRSPFQLPWLIVLSKGISASTKANETRSSPSSSPQSCPLDLRTPWRVVQSHPLQGTVAEQGACVMPCVKTLA